MLRFLLHWLLSAVALAIAVRLVPGLSISSAATLVVAALVLGLINAVVRPILLLLTLPLTVLTFGAFYLVVNGVTLALSAALVPGFTIRSFGAAVLGALVVSLVSLLFRILVP